MQLYCIIPQKIWLKIILCHENPQLNLIPKKFNFVLTLSEGDAFIYNICFLHITMPKERGNGLNKVLYQEAPPQGPNSFPFVKRFFFQKRLHCYIHVASSLKPFSHTYSRPTISLFMGKFAIV